MKYMTPGNISELVDVSKFTLRSKKTIKESILLAARGTTPKIANATLTCWLRGDFAAFKSVASYLDTLSKFQRATITHKRVFLEFVANAIKD